ncbi:phosphatase PAP2 family protein [Moraxella sp. ZY210820]|uniref:phosphatase PAP2 family protein n=1 Tax=unclassified Moraxella TaxID=2685852 RepID=UPI00272FF836|nr:phosphatase PAP2 family protein [Moraxella sp. ZY210820]WLF84562.1 phosphatase PAP2 family protein [Moraxella sp. ZY210820]
MMIMMIGIGQFDHFEPRHFVSLTLLSVLIPLILKTKNGRFVGFAVLLLSYVIFPMFSLIGNIIPYRFDDKLYQLDTWIFGQSLPLYFTYRPVWLSEYLALCYLALFPLQILSCYFWFKNHKQHYQLFSFGLAIMFVVGYMGYLVIPAQGGYLAYPDVFYFPNTGGYITTFLMNANKPLIVGIDAFPSLHTGFAVLINGFFFIKKCHKIGLALLPITIGLIISTQYFAFHYGVDLLAGIILAIGILIFISCYQKVQ